MQIQDPFPDWWRVLFIMPPSHCHEFCLRTNTNWHSLRIAQHRFDSNYFVIVRCHFRISSQADTNVLKCSKHSYRPYKSKPICIASYCIAERRINSCQFLLVRISSLYIRIDSLYIRTGIRRLSAVTQYVCNTMRNDRIVILDRTCSHWFVWVPISSYCVLITSKRNRIDSPSPPYYFVLHRVAIVLHLIASHCIVSIRVWFVSDSHGFANNHRIKPFWFGIEEDPVRTPNF